MKESYIYRWRILALSRENNINLDKLIYTFDESIHMNENESGQSMKIELIQMKIESIKMNTKKSELIHDPYIQF